MLREDPGARFGRRIMRDHPDNRPICGRGLAVSG